MSLTQSLWEDLQAQPLELRVKRLEALVDLLERQLGAVTDGLEWDDDAGAWYVPREASHAR